MFSLTSDTPSTVEIVEVSPRDGLQAGDYSLDTQGKIDLIRHCASAGVKRIEAVSFVHPGRVPAMADAEAILSGLGSTSNFVHIGLVLNRRGAERALDTAVHELGAVCAATDSFADRNQGMTARESVEQAGEIIRIAQSGGRRGQVTIAVAFGCPYEGIVSPANVVAIAQRLAAHNPREIALADTIGVAAPSEVSALVAAVAKAIEPIPVRAHFHNTRGTGAANVWAAVQAGARAIDASLGGLGGCPFAPGATGNVATEDVVYLLERCGVGTGIDLDQIIEASRWLGSTLGAPLHSMVVKAGTFPRKLAA
jgi:hydroxymethylglutaryl-CoA lyase